jgi:hypothetical protein
VLVQTVNRYYSGPQYQLLILVAKSEMRKTVLSITYLYDGGKASRLPPELSCSRCGVNQSCPN